MTTLRQPYYELSPAVYNALVQAKTALENSTLDTTLMDEAAHEKRENVSR